MGIRFQTQPGSEPSQIILHVSLLDRETTLQQEAIGILGVNLIHSSLYGASPTALVRQLLDDLSSQRIEIDLIEFSGAAFAQVDNRLMILGWCTAASRTRPCSWPMERSCSRPKSSTNGRFWFCAAVSGR